MSKFKATGFLNSFSYALRGLRLAIKSQKNFRIELVFACFALMLSIVLRFSIIEYCILVLIITLVLVSELFNSIIEFTLDAIYGNKYSKLVEMAKDLSAAAVLIVTIMSCLIGLTLFIHKIIYIV